MNIENILVDFKNVMMRYFPLKTQVQEDIQSNKEIITNETDIKLNNKLDKTTFNGHTHTIANVTNLQTTLNNKSNTNHTHSNYLTSHQDISGKENISNKVKSWNSTTNDTRYPTEKLVKNSLDNKSDINHTHSNYLTSHQDISGKENTSNKVKNWSSTTNDTHYPTEKLVKNSLDNKVDKVTGKGLFSGSYNDLTNKPTIPTKTSQLTNDSSFLTTHQDISGKENTSNKTSSWNPTTNNTRYPTEKLVKDSLDTKVDKVSGQGLMSVGWKQISGWGVAEGDGYISGYYNDHFVLIDINNFSCTLAGNDYTAIDDSLSALDSAYRPKHIFSCMLYPSIECVIQGGIIKVRQIRLNAETKNAYGYIIYPRGY